jgi:hypothetical protein
VVTVTSTVPFGAEGAVAEIDVGSFTVNEADLVPNRTVVAVSKLVPVIDTDVPPDGGPTEGDTPVTVGGATLNEAWATS